MFQRRRGGGIDNEITGAISETKQKTKKFEYSSRVSRYQLSVFIPGVIIGAITVHVGKCNKLCNNKSDFQLSGGDDTASTFSTAHIHGIKFNNDPSRRGVCAPQTHFRTSEALFNLGVGMGEQFYTSFSADHRPKLIPTMGEIPLDV